MATFDPIFYSYVPTAPRCKSATAQYVPAQYVPAQKQSSIPGKIQCIKPNDALAVAVVSADEDPGYRSEIRAEELQYTALRTKDIVPEDLSPDNTTRGDKDIALSKTNNDCPWMKEITDSPSNRPLVLADDESDIPNLQAASVSTSAYFFDHEKLWDVEESGFENENPPLEQDTSASISGQDQPYSYRNSPRTSQNHINLLENDKSKQSASEMTSLHPLLTILDKNSEERENKDISENGTDLLLAFGKQEKSATVLGSSYSHPHFTEISHLHNDPEYEQSVITHTGPEELRDSSPPQQYHDEDQPEQQQHEEVPAEAV
ncbi:hypothetical protein CJF32_00011307 [Rutstroemia sp. NJR-2017a WRK4]|nr:hypothetical protein CJF32_00011307 [Rutstroemia sp. NJR-2017a WRK4]